MEITTTYTVNKFVFIDQELAKRYRDKFNRINTLQEEINELRKELEHLEKGASGCIHNNEEIKISW